VCTRLLVFRLTDMVAFSGPVPGVQNVERGHIRVINAAWYIHEQHCITQLLKQAATRVHQACTTARTNRMSTRFATLYPPRKAHTVEFCRAARNLSDRPLLFSSAKSVPTATWTQTWASGCLMPTHRTHLPHSDGNFVCPTVRTSNVAQIAVGRAVCACGIGP
jgi:hypothetical protein